MQAAVRYKVNASEITARVTAELAATKKTVGQKSHAPSNHRSKRATKAG